MTTLTRIPISSRGAIIPKYCSGTADTVDAKVELQQGSITKSFTTRNTARNTSQSTWHCLGARSSTSKAVGDSRSLAARAAKLLELEFEFNSRMVDMMFGPFFEQTCNSLVDAFTRRAADVYSAMS